MTTSDHPSVEPTAEHEQPTPSLAHRKPAHLTWESFADRRIREAEEHGAFAQLPGLGQPIPDIDQPLEDNWWVKKKLREENLSVLPPTLEARRQIEIVRQQILGLNHEQMVRQRLEALNETIRKAIYATTAGPANGVQLIDIDAEIASWKETRNALSRGIDPSHDT